MPDAIDQCKSPQHKGPLQGASCYCDALRSGHNFLLDEVAESRAGMRFPLVLCLDESIALAGSGMAYQEGNDGAGWEMIYSAHALARLDKSYAQLLVREAVMRLKPGGRLLLSNISSDLKIRPCPACSYSKQKRRTPVQVAELTRYVPQNLVAGQVVFSDTNGLNVYLEVYKRTIT